MFLEVKWQQMYNGVKILCHPKYSGKLACFYKGRTIYVIYLIDTYPELNVMCIQKLFSEEQVIDILSILRGLNDRKDIVIYMDVEPYDIQWLWLCEKALEFGIDIKILVSIREEDFQRSPIDYSKHNFEEISLDFSKDEAKEIYVMYSNSTYLSFDDAWKSFGEKGPLMEYIFMLNESKTLVARINAQIENIINHEEQADAWLECLAIISLAGIHNNSISINSLFQKVECKQKLKMIKHFEKEYFIKMAQNNTYMVITGYNELKPRSYSMYEISGEALEKVAEENLIDLDYFYR